jgi:hypothetical protein
VTGGRVQYRAGAGYENHSSAYSWGKCAMQRVLFLWPIAFLGLPAVSDAGDKEVLAKDLTANVAVRLVAARVSEARHGNLIAKFVPVEGKERKEICIDFPAHSQTTHETTLMNLVKSCVDWSAEDKRGQWHAAGVEAIFSIPKTRAGAGPAGGDLRQCYLVSLKLPKAK